MKSINFSKGIEKEINININLAYYEDYLNKYVSKYGTLMVIDSKLKKHVKFHDYENIVFIPGGQEAKYFDKYLDLCKTIIKGNYNDLVVVGGGSLIDQVGYTFNTLDFPKGRLTIVPTTLSSMIYLPVSGEFYLDMNYTKNFLKVNGYPDIVYVDPYFCKYLEKDNMKKYFILGYILGLLFDKKFAELSFKYSKNFLRLDLEEYLYQAIKFVLSLYSNDLVFPGTKLVKYLIDTEHKKNLEFIESEYITFVFLSYVSLKLGYIDEDMFENIYKDLKSFGLSKSFYSQIIKLKSQNIPIFETLITRNGFVNLHLNLSELMEFVPEFKVLMRGV